MIIAIDGPAASGKGTLGRRLAEHFGLRHMDTGLLYRAVGFAVLRSGSDPSNAVAAEAAARALRPEDLEREQGDEEAHRRACSGAGPEPVVDVDVGSGARRFGGGASRRGGARRL